MAGWLQILHIDLANWLWGAAAICFDLYWILLNYIGLFWMALNCIAWHWLHWIWLHCLDPPPSPSSHLVWFDLIALNCFRLHWIALHCIDYAWLVCIVLFVWNAFSFLQQTLFLTYSLPPCNLCPRATSLPPCSLFLLKTNSWSLLTWDSWAGITYRGLVL